MKIMLDGKPAKLRREREIVVRTGQILNGLGIGQLLSFDGMCKRLGRSRSLTREVLREFKAHRVMIGGRPAWGSLTTVKAIANQREQN